MTQETSPFEDLELLISDVKQPGGYRVTATTRQAGEANGTLALDPQAPEIQSVLEAIASRNTTDDLLHQFGQRLFEALIAGAIANLYNRSGTPLRLRLRIEPPEIAALPWEFIYDPGADLYLAISPDHCLSRYVPVNEPVRTLEVKPPLRALIVVSDPSDLAQQGLPPLNAAEEIKRIQDALQERIASGQVETEVLPHAVAPDLRQKLRTFRPHVIHWIGHGGFEGDQGVLVMETENHLTRLVTDKQFREFFLGADDAKLVLLNACQGATQSSTRALAGLAPQIVRRGLSAVVAMQYPIPDQVSLSFAREFYRALAEYYPVDMAVSEGRRAVYQDLGSDRPDWGTPVILMRAPDGKLFSPPQSPATGKPGTQTEGVSVSSQGAVYFGGDVSGGDMIKGNIASPSRTTRNIAIEQVTPHQVHNILVKRFSLQEIQTLCFRLRQQGEHDLDYESLGDTRNRKALELVTFMERRLHLPRLVQAILDMRPDITSFDD